MSDTTITCPHCQSDIALSESLAGPMLAEARAQFASREKALAAEHAAALAETRSAARGEAQAAQAEELRALKDALKAQTDQLAAAQKAQAEAIAKERALDARAAVLELTVQQQVSALMAEEKSRAAAQMETTLKARQAAQDEAAALKIAEKDQQLEAMKAQVETLRRKAETGSQQRQGEAAEVVLEERLALAFPQDTIAEVPKGIRGADCVQQVHARGGTAGAILWESKRTEAWSRDWLPKLREDMRSTGADVAILSSRALPKEVDTFLLIDGVWVTAPAHAIALASALREGLIELASARIARAGQATKAEMVYDYITSPAFRARIEAVVEKFEAIQDDLRREQAFMVKQWAKREKALGIARDAMIGMYGDFQGIAGGAVADIEGLYEAALLGEPD
ncbi:DUF2130 domain-containing protein [Pseudaestuariivita sp.]|uniref:DUF2130 domain-containing protein n=1 Tax=Pseudaestuariivita sp. TaxID=2211669 RepID=UPI0040580471